MHKLEDIVVDLYWQELYAYKFLNKLLKDFTSQIVGLKILQFICKSCMIV